MKEIIKISADEVIALYKSAGKSEKQIESLKFEVSETPLEGIIGNLVQEPKEFSGNKYFVYEVLNADGTVIGEISVNRLFDTKVEKDDIIIIANGANAGKAMLRSHRLTNTNHLGKSRAEQIANAVGKKYKAARVSVPQPVEFTPEKLFAGTDLKSVDKVTAGMKKHLWDNTRINEKAMVIEWVE